MTTRFGCSSTILATVCWPANIQVEKFSAEEEVRAVVEGPLMAKLCHAQQLGYHVDSNTRILVTGGASENQTILQVQPEFKSSGLNLQLFIKQILLYFTFPIGKYSYFYRTVTHLQSLFHSSFSWKITLLIFTKVLADVFGASVYTLKGTKNATCLGGAYIARHGMDGIHFNNLTNLLFYTQHTIVTVMAVAHSPIL